MSDMSTPAVSPSYYADFNGFDRLRGAARANDPAAIRAAARQFESLFTRMLLKTMREASLGEGMGDSEQTQFYQDMYDQQLSVACPRARPRARRPAGRAADALRPVSAPPPPTAAAPASQTDSCGR
jgi:hypothetical protein